MAWRTVGSIIARVVADARATHDPFDGLRRTGIDEMGVGRAQVPHRRRGPRRRATGVGSTRPGQGDHEGFFDLLGQTLTFYGAPIRPQDECDEGPTPAATNAKRSGYS